MAISMKERLGAHLKKASRKRSSNPWGLTRWQDKILRSLYAHGGPLHYTQIGCCLFMHGWEYKSDDENASPFPSVSSMVTTHLAKTSPKDENGKTHRMENPNPLWQWLLHDDGTRVAGTFELTPAGKKAAEKVTQPDDAANVKAALKFHQEEVSGS